jgi:uncharacterized protein
MKLTNTAIQVYTLSFILLAGSACTQTQNLGKSKNLLQPQVQQVFNSSAIASGAAKLNAATNNYKPGINRVTFPSEGETLVGNL